MPTTRHLLKLSLLIIGATLVAYRVLFSHPIQEENFCKTRECEKKFRPVEMTDDMHNMDDAYFLTSPDRRHSLIGHNGGSDDYLTYSLGQEHNFPYFLPLFQELISSHYDSRGNIVIYAWQDSHHLNIRTPIGDNFPPIPSRTDNVHIQLGHYNSYSFNKNHLEFHIGEIHAKNTTSTSLDKGMIVENCGLELSADGGSQYGKIHVSIYPRKLTNDIYFIFSYNSTDKYTNTITNARINEISGPLDRYHQNNDSINYSMERIENTSKIIDSLLLHQVNLDYEFNFGQSAIRLTGHISNLAAIQNFKECFNTAPVPQPRISLTSNTVPDRREWLNKY